MFDAARARGYTTDIMGYYFPYGRIFDDQLNYSFSRPYVSRGRSFLEKMVITTAANLTNMPDESCRRIHWRLHRHAFSRHTYDMTREILEEILWLAEESPRDTLAFIHVPVPHWPFVFDADDSYRASQRSEGDGWGSADEAGYMRQLAFTDRMHGQILDAHRHSGKLDGSSIVLTSGHGAKIREWSDPDLHRVPFLVKVPGQNGSHVIETPTQNNALADHHSHAGLSRQAVGWTR
ncbi:MAG: sulfatase-like hydrolase/transferase [Planctomycetota bacterium]